MDTIGINLHKRESQVCILTADGELLERRMATTRERLTALLGVRPRSQVLLEASTESEWVARYDGVSRAGAERAELRRAATPGAHPERIAQRRGSRIAVVALARRLAGILFAMWRDGRPYEAARIGGPRPEVTTAA